MLRQLLVTRLAPHPTLDKKYGGRGSDPKGAVSQTVFGQEMRLTKFFWRSLQIYFLSIVRTLRNGACFASCSVNMEQIGRYAISNMRRWGKVPRESPRFGAGLSKRVIWA